MAMNPNNNSNKGAKQNGVPKKTPPKKPKSKKKNQKAKTIFGVIFSIGFSLFVAGCLTAIIVGNTVIDYFEDNIYGEVMVNLDDEKTMQNQTTILYAQNSENKNIETLRLHGTENRIWADYSEIPQNLLWAFVCLEDKRFYDHPGVDWIRTIAVMIKPAYEGQGASTITQQLIKNVTDNKEVTYNRKFNEIIQALNLEMNYSKKDILEAYLNTAYLGEGCYGVKTAAEVYFGKELNELNLAECSILASITKAPYTLSPYVNTDGKLEERQETCLNAMFDEGKITEKQLKEALETEIVLVDKNEKNAEDEEEKEEESQETYGWYNEYVIDQVIKDIQEKYEMDYSEAWDKVYNGGLNIYTAVDLDAQEIIENAYENREGFPSAYKDSRDQYPQSAITVLDYQGRIVAQVGGTGEKTSNNCYNRATDARAKRQPGSSIKPLAVYAPAIDLGIITPSSTILEEAIILNGKEWPRNYNGDYGSGEYISVETALARSLNTVPVRILNEMLGVTTSFNYCNDKFHLNLSELDKDLSPLAVGGTNTGVTTLEMAAAFATFGNGGRYYEPYSYYKVVDRDTNEVILDNTKNLPEQAISENTADDMLGMLTTAVTASYGTGYGGKIDGFQTFAKTGTTSDNCDKWFCGGTPQYVTSIWYGYDYRADLKTGGSSPSKTIYKNVLQEVHEGLDSKTFADVKNEVDASIEKINPSKDK